MSNNSYHIECERNARSILGHYEVPFRLTYLREFLPGQAVWRDFLVNSEQMGPVVPPRFAAAVARVS
jgi:hypothetical protein